MRILLIGALALSCLACSAPPGRTAEPYGVVTFENSGAPAAQAAFARGMALLHDFEYADAAVAFREAQAADPGFAMAYWGEAMTNTHPVWFEQDLAQGRAALAKLGPDPQSRAAKARTEREKAYLAAAEILYGEGGKQARDLRFRDAMAEIHRRWPDDEDAAAFHALALLGTAHQGRDTAIYMRAAAVAEEALPKAPEHPGLLHYLIHAYDDPAHAPLGMRAALIYGRVAPRAGHALHMTSHIFIARGMWDDVIAANEQAIRVSSEREAKDGRPAVVCGHYPEWRVYALLQTRRMDEAAAAIAACRARALSALERDREGRNANRRSPVVSYADMLVRQAVETGKPVDRQALPLGDGAYPRPAFRIAYADALAAAGRADAAGLAAARRRMGSGSPDHDEQVMLGQVEALQAIAAGRTEPGLAKLRETAAAEAAAPFEFGPPGVPKPTQEVLGEVLARLGRPAEAAAAFRSALDRAPGRTISVQGLAEAQGKANRTATADPSSPAAAAHEAH